VIEKYSEIVALVESEIKNISDPRIVAHIRQLRVVPYVVNREWNYGIPNQQYPCWSVLEHSTSNIGISFCEFGFGPRSPWGLVLLSGTPTEMSMGMDCGWYTSLEEAYCESLAAELPIWRVYRQQDGENYPGEPLSPEGEWDATWKEVYRLREIDKNSRYHCSQTIQVQKE
jgi:hypothetical protein